MKLRAVVLGLAVASCLLLSRGNVIAAKEMQEGAFLTEYADSVSSLIDQLEGNRVIALRYAKHFRMEPSALLTYFRNQLSISQINESTSMEVYFLDESRNILSESREFKSGTKVFINGSGVPVLEIGTGNPLRNSLSATGIKQPSPADGGSSTSTKKASAPPAKDTPPIEPIKTLPPEVKPVPSSPPQMATSLPTLPEVNPIPSGIGEIHRTKPALSRWLLPAGIGGLVLIMASVGNDGGSGTSPTDPGKGTGGHPVVPEPASLALLTPGLLGMGAFIMRRKR